MITSDNSQRDVQYGHTEVLSDLERLKQKRDAIAVVYHSMFFKEGETVLMKPTTKHVHRQPDAETMSQTTVPLSVCWALLRSARGFEMSLSQKRGSCNEDAHHPEHIPSEHSIRTPVCTLLSFVNYSLTS